MGVIPKSIQDAAKANGGTSKFIKAEEFEGSGLILTVKSFEKISAKNPKFGANDKDALFEQKMLDKGETFCYTFTSIDTDGFETERVVESKSLAFFIAFSQVDPDAGTKVRISKVGKMEETRYTIEPVK